MKEREIRFDEINLRCLLKDFIRNLWVVVLVCISAVILLTGYYKQGYQPKYTSTATIAVSDKGSSSAFNSLSTTRDMTTVFAEVFQSKILRAKVDEALGGETFQGKIITAAIPETNLMTVSVVADTPERAFLVLNLALDNYASISDYLFSNAVLNVIKAPSVPVAPSNPLNTAHNRKIIVALAAVLSLAAIMFFAIMRDTVQTVKAARRKLDAKFLRTICHEVKNKTLKSKFCHKNTAPLITGPMITRRFKKENASLASAVEYHMRKRGQKVLMVCSAGENEGKSTVTVNMALSLAKQGKKVILLDCDFRKPSIQKILEMEVPEDRNLRNFLNGKMEDPEEVLIDSPKYGITLGLNHSGTRHSYGMINSKKMTELIDSLREKADYIILDTPPMLAAVDADALSKLTDAAMVIVRMDYMKTAAINDCLDNLRQSVPDLMGVVFNNYLNTPFQ